MGEWWHREIIDSGKLPLLLAFLSFVVTFLVTRVITRMIRSGRGPFRDQVSAGGVHVHHAVPGIVLLVVGSFVSIGTESYNWLCAAAILVGTGVSLVLDEFALILHLEDVYWTQQGQVSVAAVSLTAGWLGFALVGINPFGVNDLDSQEVRLRAIGIGLLTLEAVFTVVVLRKGKYVLAVLGLFVPGMPLINAIRLARPYSRWAANRYDEVKMARAEERMTHFVNRWGRHGYAIADFIAGRPTPLQTTTQRPGAAAGRSGTPGDGAPATPPGSDQ